MSKNRTAYTTIKGQGITNVKQSKQKTNVMTCVQNSSQKTYDIQQQMTNTNYRFLILESTHRIFEDSM